MTFLCKKRKTTKFGNKQGFWNISDHLPICQFMFEDVEADDVISAIVQSSGVANDRRSSCLTTKTSCSCVTRTRS